MREISVLETNTIAGGTPELAAAAVLTGIAIGTAAVLSALTNPYPVYTYPYAYTYTYYDTWSYDPWYYGYDEVIIIEY